MKIKKKEPTGGDFLSLALYAFGGLGLEALYAFLIEPLVYGSQMNEWSTGQSICHWIITCITWGIVAYLLVKYAEQKYDFKILERTARLKTWQWIATAVSVIATVGMNYLDWEGLKIIREFQNKGLLLFTFQYIYYLFETVLFMLIIIFGQKACEIWFHRKNIPYGGIVVALTWGLAHWFTKGSLFAGLGTAFFGFCFGAVYLLLNRNVKWTYLILFIMFAV